MTMMAQAIERVKRNLDEKWLEANKKKDKKRAIQIDATLSHLEKAVELIKHYGLE